MATTKKTDEIQALLVPLTDEEILFNEMAALEAAARQADQDAMAAARESALVKLTALGLSEEEVKALING